MEQLDTWIIFKSSGRKVYHFSNNALINNNKSSKGAGLQAGSPKADWDPGNRMLELTYHTTHQVRMDYDCSEEYSIDLRKRVRNWLRRQGIHKDNTIIIVDPIVCQNGSETTKFEVQLYWKNCDCPSEEWMKDFEKMVNEPMMEYDGCGDEENEEIEEDSFDYL